MAVRFKDERVVDSILERAALEPRSDGLHENAWRTMMVVAVARGFSADKMVAGEALAAAATLEENEAAIAALGVMPVFEGLLGGSNASQRHAGISALAVVPDECLSQLSLQGTVAAAIALLSDPLVRNTARTFLMRLGQLKLLTLDQISTILVQIPKASSSAHCGVCSSEITQCCLAIIRETVSSPDLLLDAGGATLLLDFLGDGATHVHEHALGTIVACLQVSKGWRRTLKDHSSACDRLTQILGSGCPGAVTRAALSLCFVLQAPPSPSADTALWDSWAQALSASRRWVMEEPERNPVVVGACLALMRSLCFETSANMVFQEVGGDQFFLSSFREIALEGQVATGTAAAMVGSLACQVSHREAISPMLRVELVDLVISTSAPPILLNEAASVLAVFLAIEAAARVALASPALVASLVGLTDHTDAKVVVSAYRLLASLCLSSEGRHLVRSCAPSLPGAACMLARHTQGTVCTLRQDCPAEAALGLILSLCNDPQWAGDIAKEVPPAPSWFLSILTQGCQAEQRQCLHLLSLLSQTADNRKALHTRNPRLLAKLKALGEADGSLATLVRTAVIGLQFAYETVGTHLAEGVPEIIDVSGEDGPLLSSTEEVQERSLMVLVEESIAVQLDKEELSMQKASVLAGCEEELGCAEKSRAIAAKERAEATRIYQEALREAEGAVADELRDMPLGELKDRIATATQDMLAACERLSRAAEEVDRRQEELRKLPKRRKSDAHPSSMLERAVQRLGSPNEAETTESKEKRRKSQKSRSRSKTPRGKSLREQRTPTKLQTASLDDLAMRAKRSRSRSQSKTRGHEKKSKRREHSRSKSREKQGKSPLSGRKLRLKDIAPGSRQRRRSLSARSVPDDPLSALGRRGSKGLSPRKMAQVLSGLSPRKGEGKKTPKGLRRFRGDGSGSGSDRKSSGEDGSSPEPERRKSNFSTVVGHLGKMRSSSPKLVSRHRSSSTSSSLKEEVEAGSKSVGCTPLSSPVFSPTGSPLLPRTRESSPLGNLNISAGVPVPPLGLPPSMHSPDSSPASSPRSPTASFRSPRSPKLPVSANTKKLKRKLARAKKNLTEAKEDMRATQLCLSELKVAKRVAKERAEGKEPKLSPAVAAAFAAMNAAEKKERVQRRRLQRALMDRRERLRSIAAFREKYDEMIASRVEKVEKKEADILQSSQDSQPLSETEERTAAKKMASLEKAMLKRRNAARSLLDAETEFAARLGGFLEAVGARIRATQWSAAAFLPEGLADGLFSDVMRAYLASQAVKEQLEGRLALWSDAQIVGDILLENAGVIVDSVAGYAKRPEAAERLRATNVLRSFALLLTSWEDQCRGNSFLSILQEPKKRVEQHKALCEKLLRYTCHDHPDYDSLLRAKKKLSSASELCKLSAPGLPDSSYLALFSDIIEPSLPPGHRKGSSSTSHLTQGAESSTVLLSVSDKEYSLRSSM